jgi:uncharacterized membrane-anchored protein
MHLHRTSTRCGPASAFSAAYAAVSLATAAELLVRRDVRRSDRDQKIAASLRRMTTIPSTPRPRRLTTRQMLNKVPEITLYFWVIKVLCTTVGETASDYLATNLNLGLTNTTVITASLLVATLVFQFRARRYSAGIYWLGIVLISVVGTQITDNLTDNLGVSLVTTTTAFGAALALAFGSWFASERTLSIHTIYTTRREAFYWLAILFTFALGTAAGDLTAERLNLGYPLSVLLFAGVIALIAGAHYRLGLNAVVAFWLAYVMTRPLGASLGDYLSQPRADGGLGLGTTVTSVLFLCAILVVVTYLAITKKDTSRTRTAVADRAAQVLVAVDRHAVTPGLADVLRARTALGPATFHVLVANPAAAAEVTEHERQRHVDEAKRVLQLTLPFITRAVGNSVTGSVSIRHDPMDAIEEALHDGDFHEIVLSTQPHSVTHWLHLDLPRRVEHLGLPTTVVVAEHRDTDHGEAHGRRVVAPETQAI